MYSICNYTDLTESSAIPSPTSSSTSAHSTTSSISSKKVVSSTSHTSVVVSVTSTSSVVPSATNSSQSSTFSEARSNAVGGGVVGGLAGVTIIFGLLFWYVHNRKRTARNGLPLPSPAASNNPSWHGRGPYMTQVPAPPGASDQHPSSVSPATSLIDTRHYADCIVQTSSVGNQTPYHHDSSAFGSADSVPAGRSQVWLSTAPWVPLILVDIFTGLFWTSYVLPLVIGFFQVIAKSQLFRPLCRLYKIQLCTFIWD